MADFLQNVMSQIKGEKKPAEGKPKPGQPPTPKEPETPEKITTEFIEKLNNLTRSIRTLEERYNNLRRRTQLTDHNILVQHQKLNKELRLNDSDLIDIKRELQSLNNKLNMLEKELALCARKQELDIQAKYIGYWQPLNFITRTEAEKLIRAAWVEKHATEPKPEIPKPKKPIKNREIY